MNRRGFLSTLAAVAAGAIWEPDGKLWIPAKKLISIPKPPPWPPAYIPEYYPIDPIQIWPRPPLVVVANRSPEDVPCADILNALLEHRWKTDLKFRQQFDSAAAQDFIRDCQMKSFEELRQPE